MLDLQASERRILVQLYYLQSEAWEHAELEQPGDTFAVDTYVPTEA